MWKCGEENNVIPIRNRGIKEEVEECLKRGLITYEEANCWCGITDNADHEHLKEYAEEVKTYCRKRNVDTPLHKGG